MTDAEYRAYVGRMKELARPGRDAAFEAIYWKQVRRQMIDAGAVVAQAGIALGVGLLGAWALSRPRDEDLVAKK